MWIEASASPCRYSNQAILVIRLAGFGAHLAIFIRIHPLPKVAFKCQPWSLLQSA